MTNARDPYVDYFASHNRQLWDWFDDGAVVAWGEGGTIVFRAELTPILERLAGVGLPSFEALVILLSACRDSGDPRDLRRRLMMSDAVQLRILLDLIDQVIPRLAPVFEMRGQLASLEARIELAEMVLAGDRSRKTPAESQRIMEKFRQRTPLPSSPGRLSPTQFAIALNVLRVGLQDLDLTALQRRLRTGVEQLPVAAALDIPPSDSIRGLIDVLRQADHDELSGVARLAARLLAALQLPRTLEDQDEQPTGGISDITNRGAFDRLLLSELAQDDLTLTVRVAMNEALYLRREPLASPPSRRRCVLIDSGLRMWGAPRLFATSIGLAFAASEDQRLAVEIYRAEGPSLAPVDLRTPEGITRHLEQLRIETHPGESLVEFRRLGDAADRPAELVLVTHADVWDDGEFREAWQASGIGSATIATVTRAGDLRLFEKTRRGVRAIRQARFDIDDLLQSPPRRSPRTSLRDASREPLPAIFEQSPFPLRFSTAIAVETCWPIEGIGTFTYRKDGQLLLWDSNSHGARHLTDGLPPGRPLAFRAAPVGDTCFFVAGQLGPHSLHSVSVNITTNASHVVSLLPRTTTPRALEYHDGVLFLFGDNTVEALSIESGATLDQFTLEGTTLRTGRHWRIGNDARRWLRVVFDGVRLHGFEISHPAGSPPLALLIDTPRNEAIGITVAGERWRLEQGTLEPLTELKEVAPLRLVTLSRDCRWAILATDRPGVSEKTSGRLLSLDTGGIRACPDWSHPERFVNSLQMHNRVMRGIRCHFEAVGIDAQGRLALAASGDAIPLELVGKDLRMGRKCVSVDSLRLTRSFTPLPSQAPYASRLTRAEWADGSVAWLDNRGLLHLRSSDPLLPEVSIVLCPDSTSGWCSTGELWGSSYFHEARSLATKSTFEPSLIPAFLERLR